MPINNTPVSSVGYTCESCGGHGYYLVNLGEQVPCSACAGRGTCFALRAAFETPNPANPCTTCAGFGTLSIPNGWRTCPDCDGSREIDALNATRAALATLNVPSYSAVTGTAFDASLQTDWEAVDGLADNEHPGQCGKAEAADRASIDEDFIDGDEDWDDTSSWDDADDSTDEYINGAEVNCDCAFCTEGRADSLAVELAHNARSFDDFDNSDDIPF